MVKIRNIKKHEFNICIYLVIVYHICCYDPKYMQKRPNNQPVKRWTAPFQLIRNPWETFDPQLLLPGLSIVASFLTPTVVRCVIVQVRHSCDTDGGQPWVSLWKNDRNMVVRFCWNGGFLVVAWWLNAGWMVGECLWNHGELIVNWWLLYSYCWTVKG